MATVPGDPSSTNVVDMLPQAFKPTVADFLQAAAIMHQKGRMQMAGDVLSFSYPGRKIGPGEEKFEQVPFIDDAKGGYTPAENVGSVAKGVMQGKVKILKPSGD
jgi:hypothetical protein